jgi:hypothetical protein
MKIAKELYPYLNVEDVKEFDKRFGVYKGTIVLRNDGRTLKYVEEKVQGKHGAYHFTSPTKVGECLNFLRDKIKAKLDRDDKKRTNSVVDYYPVPKAKEMAGKPQLRHVPANVMESIAEVREYGNKKYGNPDGWKMQTRVDYIEAAMRHGLKALQNPNSVDKESGLSHVKHMLCDLAFVVSGEIA